MFIFIFHNLLWVSIQWAYVFLFVVDFSCFFFFFFFLLCVCIDDIRVFIHPWRQRIKRESFVKNSNFMKHYHPFSGEKKLSAVIAEMWNISRVWVTNEHNSNNKMRRDGAREAIRNIPISKWPNGKLKRKKQ